ncbi:hypothetical protein GFS31_26720 [Leptolyngbya sp. BL0902]|uniref:hypothetical protein n=1 Tax=Leptolyngbya sp. BL0902 TaxID=1115757 RepID=UPI0018E7AB4B|nr:hypothetical protein [Leptolyngbya sp. BL0902]QQE65977.1 hypothetical protein GFS31_26720 [Leptolyngbya sp. BL0902]
MIYALGWGAVIAGLWGTVQGLELLRQGGEDQLAERLQRPVRVGGLRGLSRRGIHLGPLHVPPEPDDRWHGQVNTVIVGMNGLAWAKGTDPWLTVTLDQPQITLVAPKHGPWSLPRLNSAPASEDGREQDGRVRHRPDPDGRPRLAAVQIQRGQVTVLGATGTAYLEVEDLQGAVIRPAEGAMALDLTGQMDQGQFTLSGTLPQFRTVGVSPGLPAKATLQVAQLPLTALNALLPPPIALNTGVVNGHVALTVPLDGLGQPQFRGTEAQGLVMARGEGQLGQVAEPLRWQGGLWLQGQRATLHDTRLHLGNLSLTAAGQVDPLGYNLTAQVPPVAAADVERLVGQPLPLAPGQAFEGYVRVSSPWQKPELELQATGQAPPGSLALPLDPDLIATSLGMTMQGLPLRQSVPLIEGASYVFRRDGAWFTLRDGTVVPPLSEAAYNRARAQFQTALAPHLDRKFFWFLQTSPFITALAADVQTGKLDAYRSGQRFNTDRFFVEYFMPVYVESSGAAGLDPAESLWMLDHSLRTLHDPLLRTPEAKPITSGAGIVGSFWRDEQSLSMKQLVLRPWVADGSPWGPLLRYGLVRHIERSTHLENRRLASTPEVLSKLPNVTFGAEEGAIALALGIVQFPETGIYPTEVVTLARQIVENERQKQVLRQQITDQLRTLATQQTPILAAALADAAQTSPDHLGLSPHFSPTEASRLNGGNTLSILVSRSEKAGYPLTQAYANGRGLLLEWLQGASPAAANPAADQASQLVYATLRDHGLDADFWPWLAQRVPQLANTLNDLTIPIRTYHALAQQGASLHEVFYAAMVQNDQDIGIAATLKQAVGFQAHLAHLIDQAFAPADPYDPRYLAFRRSLAIYLREAPDIAVYGGTPAALRAYGQETLNVQELIAVDLQDAPRIRALAKLYAEARDQRMVGEWDVPGFQKILLLGSLLAAGVSRDELPPSLANIGFPSAQFRHHLVFAVGGDGIQAEGTRLGVQAHDYRVPFQPLPLPSYRVPSLDGTNPKDCPRQPTLAALALGPGSQFIWHPETQRVWLQRAEVSCYLPNDWESIIFPALLETVPVLHSPAGYNQLQKKLEEAQRLEAGMFPVDF